MRPLFLLDTNIVSHLIRGPSKADRRLAKLSLDEWFISAVTRAELRYGLALKPQAARLRLRVETFLDGCQTMPWDQRAADYHGSLRAALRAAGKPIGWADEMIAAHALALDCTLVTDNAKHFACVANLKCENWLR